MGTLLSLEHGSGVGSEAIQGRFKLASLNMILAQWPYLAMGLIFFVVSGTSNTNLFPYFKLKAKDKTKCESALFASNQQTGQ